VNPTPVPSLDAIAADPELVRQLPAHVCGALATRAAAVVVALGTRMAEVQNGDTSRSGPAGDRLLDVEEAARQLGVSADWLYRKAARLPFTIRLGRSLRFSSLGLERYIRQRQGR
jgi:predicted DNA-binding transcriptional regulator AlpA